MTSPPATDDALRRAMSAHQQGRLDEAAASYAEALECDPENVQALRLRGVLARQQGDLAESVRYLQTTLRVAPGDVTAANDLAVSFLASGELDAAEVALRGALGLAPDSPRALANLGALLQQRGHLAEAIAIHEHYLELVPDDLEVCCNLANALMDAGRDDESLEACDAALALAPGHPLVMANQGAVLCGLDRCDLAVEILQRALALNSSDDMALINLAYAQRALGSDEAALESLMRAVRLNPDNARAAADLGNALLAHGQPGRALEACERFLAAHPGERLVLATYAYALLEAGRRDESRRILDYEQLVRVHDLDAPDGFADIQELNRGLEEFITGHPSLLDDPARKATTGGAQTGELSPLESREFGALDLAIHRAVEQTIDRLVVAGFGDHEVMACAADRWSLRIWGTVLTGGGFQLPHQHPLGWLSGVYYVRLPDADAATDVGALEFGQPPERIGITTAPEIFPVSPRPGRLVIFPSWFYHRTRAFESPGTRISIAFDVMPLG